MTNPLNTNFLEQLVRDEYARDQKHRLAHVLHEIKKIFPLAHVGSTLRSSARYFDNITFSFDLSTFESFFIFRPNFFRSIDLGGMTERKSALVADLMYEPIVFTSLPPPYPHLVHIDGENVSIEAHFLPKDVYSAREKEKLKIDVINNDDGMSYLFREGARLFLFLLRKSVAIARQNRLYHNYHVQPLDGAVVDPAEAAEKRLRTLQQCIDSGSKRDKLELSEVYVSHHPLSISTEPSRAFNRRVIARLEEQFDALKYDKMVRPLF